MKSDYETALDMMTEIIGQMRRMPKEAGLDSNDALKEQVKRLVEDKRKLVEQLDIATDENARLEHEIDELNQLIKANEMKPKPCPFCGGRPDVFATSKERWVVACHSDTCAVNPETDSFDTIEEAVSAWNHRGELTCDWR